MLPLHDRALREIAHISLPGLGLGFDEHPANMGPQKAATCTIGVEVGVGIAKEGELFQ